MVPNNDSNSPGALCEAAEVHKREGNKHFACKDFLAAIRCYSEAIDMDGSNPMLYGNRSAAHAGRAEWSAAATDAHKSIQLNASYIKGYHRLAQALIGMGDSVGAAAATESGLEVDPENKEMQRLARKLRHSSGSRGQDRADYGTKRNNEQRRTHSSSSWSRGSTSCSGKAVSLKNLGLYCDKDDPDDIPGEGSEAGAEDARDLRRVFRSLRDSISAPGSALGSEGPSHELEGVFRQLINPEAFRRMVMPGLSEEERKGAPGTFEELLRSPVYASAVEESLPRVVAHASSILEGVKERGEKAGDTMDSATEESLKPQILQEAFARAVVNVVAAVHAKARAKVASGKSQLASSACEEASWDQLDEFTMAGLVTKGERIAVQDGFMGEEEWSSVLLQDCERFAADGKLTAGTGGIGQGEMAWVEPTSELEATLPALHELLVNLHAIPYELNSKASGLRLARPLRGSTMLLRLRAGCRLLPRLDSLAAGADTGHRVSCVYFVGRAGDNLANYSDNSTMGSSENDCSSGQLKLKNIEKLPDAGEALAVSRSMYGGVVQTGRAPEVGPYINESVGPKVHSQGHEEKEDVVLVEPLADRLVLFRSDLIRNEITEVRRRDQYVVFFWMHKSVNEEDICHAHCELTETPDRG